MFTAYKKFHTMKVRDLMSGRVGEEYMARVSNNQDEKRKYRERRDEGKWRYRRCCPCCLLTRGFTCLHHVMPTLNIEQYDQ
jgi:hypothetical protein